jgi:hypothetical protein
MDSSARNAKKKKGGESEQRQPRREGTGPAATKGHTDRFRMYADSGNKSALARKRTKLIKEDRS